MGRRARWFPILCRILARWRMRCVSSIRSRGKRTRTVPAKTSKPTLRAWSRHENLWLRRVAIISQISFREQTDVALLRDCIAPSLQSPEFWLRKAIGWALREHAKANPEDVRQYLEAHQTELSPLSRREALKGFTFVKRHGTLSKSNRSGK